QEHPPTTPFKLISQGTLGWVDLSFLLFPSRTSIAWSRYFVRREGLGYHQPFDFSGTLMARKIAIIEDEQAIADNYRDALQKLGYKVSHYLNRPDALAAFANSLPDLAIIDVGLGDDIEGGFELCRELRSRSPE